MVNLYAVVLTLIVAALLTVSMAQIRKVHTKADYLVAGRSLPAYVLVFTLLSSWIGAGSLFAGAENAFHNGFAALWGPAGGWSAAARSGRGRAGGRWPSRRARPRSPPHAPPPAPSPASAPARPARLRPA